jgi:hypothetical protein
MKRTEGERELTQRQQQALAVHEAARAAGKALSVYAREQGLEVRRSTMRSSVCDAEACWRGRCRRRTRSGFHAWRGPRSSRST